LAVLKRDYNNEKRDLGLFIQTVD